MRPEDIRRLYAEESAATDEEARDSQQRARTDPDEARALIKTLYAMSTEDRAFAVLLRMFLEASMMRLIEEHAAEDDSFALDSGKLIIDLMNMTMRPVPRGKPKTARSA